MFSSNWNLTNLSLANNRITRVYQSTFKPIFSSISSLDLSMNPIECNCELKWLIDWLNGPIRLKNEDKTICSLASLEPLRKKSLMDFDPNELCKINNSLYSLIPLISIGLVVISVLVYHYRWQLRYKLFLLKLVAFAYKEMRDARDHNDYEFDVNIIFYDDDEEWIREQLRPALEERLPQFQRNVVGDEDLVLGMHYLDSVDYVVSHSYKTIVVLSRAAVLDHWFILKFRTAMDHVSDTLTEFVVVVFLEDIPDDEMPFLARLYLSDGRPYINWTENNPPPSAKPVLIEGLNLKWPECSSFQSLYRHDGDSAMTSLRLDMDQSFHGCDQNLEQKNASCSNKGLGLVPTGLSGDTEVLDLSHNNITKLLNSSFELYPLINSLDISHNDVRAIESAAFYPLKALLYLSLSFNWGLVLPATGVFMMSSQLSILDLTASNLKSLPNDILKWSLNLDTARLFYNQLSFINVSSCGKADIVLMTGNRLQHLTAEKFTFECHTDTLNIRENPIQSVDPDVIASLRVRYLVLGGYPLSDEVLANIILGISKSDIEVLTIMEGSVVWEVIYRQGYSGNSLFYKS
ncbi:uncharacterized protein LOC115921854 [Strongylocentrotus purpuratus]|uniref:TIR domain-containing protein n=1 Tax=Strongylocentrotus purpuratus TaxID=7668 RepID=A0A7M7NFZ6_STRPU|nr:uncharacterized protein LOC115921854 [Strongylocentrotus purpuratus]